MYSRNKIDSPTPTLGDIRPDTAPVIREIEVVHPASEWS